MHLQFQLGKLHPETADIFIFNAPYDNMQNQRIQKGGLRNTKAKSHGKKAAYLYYVHASHGNLN